MINYEGLFDQKVFAHVGCRGPMIDFVVSAENKECTLLNCVYLALQVGIYRPNG